MHAQARTIAKPNEVETQQTYALLYYQRPLTPCKVFKKSTQHSPATLHVLCNCFSNLKGNIETALTLELKHRWRTGASSLWQPKTSTSLQLYGIMTRWHGFIVKIRHWRQKS